MVVTLHGERLPGARLSIGEDRGVVTFQIRIDGRLADDVEDLSLKTKLTRQFGDQPYT